MDEDRLPVSGWPGFERFERYFFGRKSVEKFKKFESL
jgi:hypothetical protein